MTSKDDSSINAAKALAEKVLIELAKNPFDFGGYIANERRGKTECINAIASVLATALRDQRAQGLREGMTRDISIHVNHYSKDYLYGWLEHGKAYRQWLDHRARELESTEGP